MAKRQSTPTTRAADKKKTVKSVRRRYKQDVLKSRKLLPGEIPHVIDMVLVMKLAGYTYTDMARIIGISRKQVANILKEEDVSEKLTLLREKLPLAALDLLEGYMIEAVQVIVDIMRRSDDKVALSAAIEVLDRAGLPKASKQERRTINEDQITVTDDGLVERLREASPEVQEEAAQLVERLEALLAASAEAEPVEEGEDA
jgi:transcriptional regulator with XRE-family HTH domain